MLARNTTLRKLDLTKNGVGDAGAQPLAEASATNTSLLELQLDGALPPELTGALRRNRTIHTGGYNPPEDVRLIRSVYRTPR